MPILAGSMVVSATPSGAGYVFTGLSIQPYEAWTTKAPMPTARYGFGAAEA